MKYFKPSYFSRNCPFLANIGCFHNFLDKALVPMISTSSRGDTPPSYDFFSKPLTPSKPMPWPHGVHPLLKNEAPHLKKPPLIKLWRAFPTMGSGGLCPTHVLNTCGKPCRYKEKLKGYQFQENSHEAKCLFILVLNLFRLQINCKIYKGLNMRVW